ncbi:hypothetical protein ACIA5D_23555 [Actinoplanes sp. NPDC051513]|uniref:hypothetical protein n=1 Tax=Actinoplanes sp. NPDC051513 TaxID=3363908 RepID=UPI0037B6BCAB
MFRRRRPAEPTPPTTPPPAGPPAPPRTHRAGGPIERIPPDLPPAVPVRPAPTPVPTPPPVVVPSPVFGPPADAEPDDIFVSLPDASRALRCLSVLSGAESRIHRRGGEWWLRAEAEPDLVRTAAHSAGGRVYARHDDLLFRYRPFGGPVFGDRGIAVTALEPSDVTDLIRHAPLIRTRKAPLHDAAVLTPGVTTEELVRRALELDLDVWQRPVRLHPLGRGRDGGRDGDGDGAGESVMLEVTVHATGARTIPAGLFAAAERLPLTTVFRRAGDQGELLVQHGAGLPIADHQLSTLLPPGGWALADEAFGSWRIEPLSDHQPAVSLIKVATGFVPQPQTPLGDHGATANAELRVVPRRSPGQRVDAVLLDDMDLVLVPLLLEGHPLAESALIIRGRDRHLLIAAGGLLVNVGVGTPLTCLGPGPLYLPIGSALSPELPPAARQRLFLPDDRHIVVLADGAALHFPIERRQPVWELWAPARPRVDLQVPPETADALAELTREQDAPRTAAPQIPQPRPFPNRPVTPLDAWRNEAWNAEMNGDLGRAAELHRAHNQPLQAAHLFERLAQLRDAERRPDRPPTPRLPEGPP